MATGNFDPDSAQAKATATQANLLERGALQQLKIIFSGATSDQESRMLLAMEGLGSVSRDVRADIIQNSISLIEARKQGAEKALSDILGRRFASYDDIVIEGTEQEGMGNGE